MMGFSFLHGGCSCPHVPCPTLFPPPPTPPILSLTHLVQVLCQRLLQKLLVLLQEAAQALQLGGPELDRPRAPRAEGLPQSLQCVREGVHPARRGRGGGGEGGSVGQGAPTSPGPLHCPCLHLCGSMDTPTGTARVPFLRGHRAFMVTDRETGRGVPRVPGVRGCPSVPWGGGPGTGSQSKEQSGALQLAG